MKIDGSVAVVTGAGSGIGRSIAAALASAGASVVVGDIEAVSAAETAAMTGGVAVAADAASAEGIAALLGTARQQFGGVDIYVANAGIVGDEIVLWNEVNVGIAVSLPGQGEWDSGLIVPVPASLP